MSSGLLVSRYCLACYPYRDNTLIHNFEFVTHFLFRTDSSINGYNSIMKDFTNIYPIDEFFYEISVRDLAAAPLFLTFSIRSIYFHNVT